MASKGSILMAGDHLDGGDYLESASKLYRAYLQYDGNFVVYRASEGDDASRVVWASNRFPGGGAFRAYMQYDGNFVVYRAGTQEVVWATNVFPGGGRFFAAMQDDGNFVIYRGDPPGSWQAAVWATNTVDPVVDMEPDGITYDLAQAQIVGESTPDIYVQHVTNDTAQQQTSSIGGGASVTETSGWSSTLGIKAGVKTSLSVGVPVVADGKVEVSAEASYSYTWSGSESRTRSWTFNAPVVVPPHSSGTVVAKVALTSVRVPFVVTGVFVTASGKRIHGQATGTYVGTSSHDLTVSYAGPDAKAHPLDPGLVKASSRLA